MCALSNEHACKEFMHWMLKFSCFSNVHFVSPRNTHKELTRTLSIWARNSCVRWESSLGTYACTEHTHVLHHALSIHIIHWVSWDYAVTEHTHQFLSSMLSISVKIQNLKSSLQNAEHTHTMRALSTGEMTKSMIAEQIDLRPVQRSR
jgi:hypothetical protein